MSQAEPYVVVRRSSSGAQQGRNFATIAAARKYAKRHGYNTIAQKKKGHAGLAVVETIDTGRRVTITRPVE